MGKFKFVKLKKNYIYLQEGPYEIVGDQEEFFIVKVMKPESYTLLKPYPHSRFDESKEKENE